MRCAWYMLDICLGYAWLHLPGKCRKFAWYMLEICLRYARELISLGLPDICLRFAWDIPEMGSKMQKSKNIREWLTDWMNEKVTSSKRYHFRVRWEQVGWVNTLLFKWYNYNSRIVTITSTKCVHFSDKNEEGRNMRLISPFSRYLGIPESQYKRAWNGQ